MNKQIKISSFLVVYILILTGLIVGAVAGSRIVTVISQDTLSGSRHCIVIDPGHGGIDGGATSCTGTLESNINLEISLRLQDLFHLMGYDTVMIRTSDMSIHTQGNSIAEKKISDLKERVRIINNTENALLVSIHQNQFDDGRYYGAQVFHTGAGESMALAQQMQAAFIRTINPGSNRKCKKAEGVYLMKNIRKNGVLVECGFLSNPDEAEKLETAEYQKKICCIIAVTVSDFLDQEAKG